MLVLLSPVRLFSWPYRRLLLLWILQCCCRVMAQEAPHPRLQIEPFASTPSFRQDFCNLTLHNNSSNNNMSNIGNLLQGIALNTNILLGEFIKFDDNNLSDNDNFDNNNAQMQNMTLNTNYPGLMARIMDEICIRAGCTWRNTYSIVGAIPANRTWSDLLIWSTNTYDISVEWWMRSTERMLHGAAFIEPWYDASIIMVTQKEYANKDNDDEGFNAGSWLLPFDNYVWLMIVVTILVSAIIYWFLEVLNPDSDHRKYQLDPIESLWLLATAFAGQFEFDPQTGPARLLSFSIAFWALLMGAAYTANLASFLVVKNKPQLVIESIEQAVRLHIPMCVYESTLTHQTIQKRFPAYARSGLLIPLAVEREVFTEIGKKCQIGITEVSTWKTFQYNELVNGDCSLYWVGRAFDFISASFAVMADSGNKCTSLVKTVFDVHMHDMSKEGKLAQLWDEHNQETATVFCQGGGGVSSSSSSGNDSGADQRRRRARFLHKDDYHVVGRTLPAAAADASSNGRYVRHLSVEPQNTGDGGGNKNSDTTQLTLKNMGGVFLLHAILSGLSLLCALIAWSHKPYTDHYKATAAAASAAAKKSIGADENNKQSKTMIRESTSSLDHDEFFDASTSVEELLLRQEMSTEPMSNGSSSGNMNGNNHDRNSISRSSRSNDDDLRMEMKRHLTSIDQKLMALLAVKKSIHDNDSSSGESLSFTF